jgi:hypothetical protein
MAQNSSPDAPPDAAKPWPSPLVPLLLFGGSLIAILAWSVAAANGALPPTALVLPAMALALLAAAFLARSRPHLGWMTGAGIAALGLLAGGYSLARLAQDIATGDLPVATLARAATALASLGFLAWAALAWRRHLRTRRTPSPLTPIGWR